MELQELGHLFGDPGTEVIELVADVEGWEAYLQRDIQCILGRVGREQERFFVDYTAGRWRVNDLETFAQGSQKGTIQAVESGILEVNVGDIEVLPEDLDPRLESDELAHDALINAFLVHPGGGVNSVVKERAETQAQTGGDFECGCCQFGLHAHDVLGEFVGLARCLGYVPDVVMFSMIGL